MLQQKLDLKNVDLFCLDCVELNRAIFAIEECKKYADFNSVKLLSSIDSEYEHLIKVDKIGSTKEYSKFMFTDLPKYVEADYVMVVQWDGYIRNPDVWNDEFLECDYIGALIPVVDIVGNGGFSLRSKRFVNYVSDLYIKSMGGADPLSEDVVISYNLRPFLEKQGFKFAMKELARKFSIEPKSNWTTEFGFHGHQDLSEEDIAFYKKHFKAQY